MGSVRELLRKGREELRASGIESPGREAALLLSSLLGLSEPQLLSHDEEPVEDGLDRRFSDLVTRRSSGEPAAYLLGRREFFGREFVVDARVLIPRPETELLVEIALALPLPEAAVALDVGTGSGCIALSLAAERPNWRPVASDISLGALACARANAQRLNVSGRVRFVAAELASPIDLRAVDLLISNPPYVDPEDPALVARDVRTFEPHLALFASERGLATIRRLFDMAAGLQPGSWLACEIGFGQIDAVLALAQARRHLELVEVRADLAGIARDVVFRRAFSK
ncbi:MAG: peptide chain release factor N(5)-glutamine methyltransferase [Thermoanaerobaculia bacterium]